MIQKPKMVLVINDNPILKYKDRYVLFTSWDKAFTYADAHGFEDILGFGINKKPGMMNQYQCGNVNIAIIALEVKS